MSETFAGHAVTRYFWLLDTGLLFALGALWMGSSVDLASGYPARDRVVWAIALVVAIAWVLYQAHTIPVPTTR